VSVSPSKAKKPAKKAKSTKGAKGKGKQTKHAKSNKWLYRRAEAAKPGESRLSTAQPSPMLTILLTITLILRTSYHYWRKAVEARESQEQ
jgi:hypothetical protein